jgi:dihydrofolate synthase / folylpolyglutamate synthase
MVNDMFLSLEQVENFLNERKKFGIKPGLDSMYRLLASQHNPQHHFKAIHIAGTNGKGSTLTYITHALIENDYRIGVFTSPSLSGFTGHILINNLPINEEYFLLLLNQLLPSIDQLDKANLHPTEFEIITTIAFMYFANNVDFAIIETGMGGREDATNCIQPILSIITNIAIDHASFLGDTLEKIAYHKAGIIKKNVPLVVGGVTSSCLPVIYQEAALKNSKIFQLNKDFFCKVNSYSRDRQSFEWSYENSMYEMEIQMQGIHQVENAATAMMALTVLKQQGIRLELDRVRAGLRNAQIAGRFEQILEKPIIILDGAHNPNGMEAFLRTVEKLFKDERKHLIFAGFRDKELHHMLQMALPYFKTITVTSFQHPRAEEAQNLIDNLVSEKIEIKDWQEKIWEIKEQDDIYFFAGSLYFIGLVRDYIKSK